jgi:putative salt-induced outer membrane protein
LTTSLCLVSPALAARHARRPPPRQVEAPEPPPPPPIVLAPPVPQPALVPVLAIPRPTLPTPVRAMIDAATTSDDAATVVAVVRMAKQTNPAFIAEIDALNDSYNAHVRGKREAAERAARERLAAAGILALWKGELELGGSRATGNTRSLGLYAALGLTREGLDWRHRIALRADLQETDGITTTERINASWQPNYKFGPRLYAYGLAQYEHDKFAGYDSRYTGGAGLGYTLVSTQKTRVEFEGGPALRQTDFIDEGERTTIAGRASVNVQWKPSATLTLTQTSALFVETGNTNATATTSLDTKLFGPLRARLSYNIQYERDAPDGRDQLDTLSRATLIYGF